jgi:hypothetical protein
MKKAEKEKALFVYQVVEHDLEAPEVEYYNETFSTYDKAKAHALELADELCRINKISTTDLLAEDAIDEDGNIHGSYYIFYLRRYNHMSFKMDQQIPLVTVYKREVF